MKMRKIILFIGVMAILVSSFCIKIDAREVESIQPYDENYLVRNLNMAELATKIEKSIMTYYEIENRYEDIYPSYFGGMYISNDAQNLIIQIVKENVPINDSEEYKFYQVITNMDDSIKIEYVENSFNDLNEINNKVSNLINIKKTLKNNLNGVYVDVMSNSTVIEVKEKSNLTESKLMEEIFDIKEYKKIASKESLISLEITSESNITQDIKPGGLVFFAQYGCSMGFRTKYSGKKGYVTAGHCTSGIANNLIPTGNVLKQQYSNNQKFDYAFVVTDSSYNPINTLTHPSGDIKTLAVLTTTCPTITVNMAIAKDGYETKYTTGKVKALNYTANYSNGVSIKGLVKTDAKTDQGDSGGVVIIPRTDANGGPIPIGIISGGAPGVLGIGKSMYFTSINDLPAEMQTGRY